MGGGGGKRKPSSPSPAPDNGMGMMMQMMQAQQAAAAAAAAAAAKAEAERQRQAAIAAENAAAANKQSDSLVTAQGKLGGMQASQRTDDAESLQKQSISNSSLGGRVGFDVNAARLQALGNVAGAGSGGAASGVAPYVPSGSASNSPATGMTPAMANAAANQDAGGTNQPSNAFTIPNTKNLTFGGA